MSDLKQQVQDFNLMELPGQPRIMHMGTSYLVNDLWKRIKELEAQIAAVKETTDDPYVFVVHTEDGKKPMPFVAVADFLDALEKTK